MKNSSYSNRIENREFSKDEIQSIETELDKFNLASIPRIEKIL
jgi:hypothetical protein